MTQTNGSANGVAGDASESPSPSEILDLSASCVRFVKRSTGVELDGTPETLPLLDHYLRENAAAAATREEAREVVVLAAGAYIGELVRRAHASWWRLEDGIAEARIELRDVFLAFSPMQTIRDAFDAHAAAAEKNAKAAVDADAAVDAEAEVDADERDPDAAAFELDDADRADVEMRLAELPHVSREEYYAPSTRLEVIDIAVDAIRTKRVAAGDPELTLEPADYD